MYICYLDESGIPELAGNTAHFVYAGIAIPADTWFVKDREINLVKGRYGLDNSEIHAGWINRKYAEQMKVPGFNEMERTMRRREIQTVRLSILNDLTLKGKIEAKKEKTKYFRKTDAYVHLTFAERQALLNDLANVVKTWEDSRIFFEAVKKAKYAPSRVSAGGMYEDSFQQVVTRYQAFLENRGNFEGKSLLGLLVSDNNESINRKLTGLMRKFHAEGTFWRGIDKVIETPLFVDSKLTSMIQVADLIAYAVRRFFDNNETELIGAISPRFDRAKGKVVGVRHFTGAETCTCKVCIAHGRS